MKLLIINVNTLLSALITSDLAHAALRGSVYTSIKSSSDQCIPDERPQVQAGDSPHSNRERFRLVERDAICIGTNHLPYEVGVFTNVEDSTECANKCIKDAGWDLQPLLRGINMMCDTNECECLYDMGTLNDRSARAFDWSNHNNRNRKGVGAVDTLVSSQRGANCFSLTSNSNFFESMYELIQSDANKATSSSSEDNQRLNHRAWKWEDSSSETEDSMSSDDSNSTSFDSSSDGYSSSSEDYHRGGHRWVNDNSSSSSDDNYEHLNRHGHGKVSASEYTRAESFVEFSCRRKGQACGWHNGPLGSCCAGLRCEMGLYGPGVCR